MPDHVSPSIFCAQLFLQRLNNDGTENGSIPFAILFDSHWILEDFRKLSHPTRGFRTVSSGKRLKSLSALHNVTSP